MAVLALDTYEVVKELRAAGFDEAQAAALTSAVKRAQQVDLSELATKADLTELKLATQSDMGLLKSSLEKSILDAKVDTLRRVVGIVGFQLVAIIGGLVAILRSVTA